jgi:hypothetical protein
VYARGYCRKQWGLWELGETYNELTEKYKEISRMGYKRVKKIDF